MPDLTPEEQYQKDYDAEIARLDAAESGNADATTATTATTPPADKPPETAVKPEGEEVVEKPLDPLDELRAKLEKTDKALKDTQAWGTRNAQELAALRREREQQQRATTKPAILDQTPELEEAIRHVVGDPVPRQQQQDAHQQRIDIIDRAHPGIFTLPDSDELVQAVAARAQELGPEWDDPLVAIREITKVKLAHNERLVGKRFAQEAARQAQKSAMSVPGAGGSGNRQTTDSDKEATDRILKMTDAEFEKEVRRVKGY